MPDATLLQKIEELSARVAALEAENTTIKQENVRLKNENRMLRQKLDQYIRHHFGGQRNEGLDKQQLELLLQGLPNVIVLPMPESLTTTQRHGTVHPVRRMLSTMVTTTARPPGRVLVTGLGPVGHLAAQIFSSIGYRVEGFDILPERRKLLQEKGVTVLDKIEEGEIYDLAIECSGHEGGLLQAAKAVRKGGEVVMVGVPWRKNCDLSAYDILTVIFHRYIRVRTGWEWEVPMERQSFGVGSLEENYNAALQWLTEGQINVDGLYDLADPKDCQEVYTSLNTRTRKFMATVFDWRKLD